MAEIDGISLDRSNPPAPTGYQFENIPTDVIEVGNLKNGMWVDVAREQVPKGSILLGENVRIRHRGIQLREGTSEIVSPAPNGNNVVKSFTFVKEDGTVYLIRIDYGAFYASVGGGWVLFTHPFVGTNYRYTNAQYLDQAFIANGSNRVMEIDFGTNTVSEIANAPVAKFITTFADRIIAANIDNDKPYLVKWPVNADPTDWVGLGSGEEPLLQTDDDLSDEISGLFGFGQTLILLRKRSMWMAERQPSADRPFSFRELFPGIGCDMPYAAVRAGNGIIFPNSEEKAVYYWEPGIRPEIISTQVEEQIFSSLSEPKDAKAGWDQSEMEYHLGIPTIPGLPWLTETWVYNKKNKAWVKDTTPVVTSIDAASPSTGGFIAIDDLTGTIDALGPSDIDNLKNETSRVITTIMKGTPTGELISLRRDLATDYNGGFFLGYVVGPNFGSISSTRVLKDLGFSISGGVDAHVEIQVSNDKTNWKYLKDYTQSNFEEKNFRMKKRSLTGKNLYWRVQIRGSSYIEIHSWWARILTKHLLR